MDDKKNKTLYFENLDGLRVVAFAFVCSAHLFYNSFELLNIQEGVIKSILSQFIGNGTAGVYIFFVLSGFLITYLLLKEKEETESIDIKAFYIRRFLRIWPLYYLIVLFGFVVYPILRELVQADAPLLYKPLYYLFFLSNFDVINIMENHDGIIPGFMEVTWSVSIEEQFYLIWPLFFAFIKKKNYLYIFYALIVISILFNFYGYFSGHEHWGRHTLSCIYLLSIGGLAAYYSLYNTPFLHFFNTLKKKYIILIYFIGLLLFSLSTQFNSNIYIDVFIGVVIAIFFGFIILEQNFSLNSFYKFSNFKLFSSLGKYTYGLYLLHSIAGVFVLGLVKMGKINPEKFTNSFLIGFTTLIISLVISYASYHLMEKHFLKLKRKFTKLQ